MDKQLDQDKPVSIGPRLIAEGGFASLYEEGMGLIEEVASYLDGPGREESKGLSREASFVYASESMRLTTRLMQLASWLLLQRAVAEGELSEENARAEKDKVKFSTAPARQNGPGWDGLPARLLEFIERGDRLFQRVQQFEKLDRLDVTNLPKEDGPAGGIADQLSRLKAAFPMKR